MIIHDNQHDIQVTQALTLTVTIGRLMDGEIVIWIEEGGE